MGLGEESWQPNMYLKNLFILFSVSLMHQDMPGDGFVQAGTTSVCSQQGTFLVVEHSGKRKAPEDAAKLKLTSFLFITRGQYISSFPAVLQLNVRNVAFLRSLLLR